MENFYFFFAGLVLTVCLVHVNGECNPMKVQTCSTTFQQKVSSKPQEACSLVPGVKKCMSDAVKDCGPDLKPQFDQMMTQIDTMSASICSNGAGGGGGMVGGDCPTESIMKCVQDFGSIASKAGGEVDPKVGCKAYKDLMKCFDDFLENCKNPDAKKQMETTINTMAKAQEVMVKECKKVESGGGNKGGDAEYETKKKGGDRDGAESIMPSLLALMLAFLVQKLF